MTKLTAGPGKLVLKPSDALKKTKSGLIVPESQKPPLQHRVCEVVDAPDHCASLIGQTVIISAFGGTVVAIEKTDEEFIIIQETDLLAVVGKEE